MYRLDHNSRCLKSRECAKVIKELNEVIEIIPNLKINVEKK